MNSGPATRSAQGEALTPLDIVTEALAPLPGKPVLDFGCGDGRLARALLGVGANVFEVDPSSPALAAARTLAPGARFAKSQAEQLPFDDNSFEGAVFLNSLHHVSPEAMAAALLEAARVTTPGGVLIGVEPLASGSFFSAFQAVEDETMVRRQAQIAISHALLTARLSHRRTAKFVRSEAFAGFEAFLTRVTAAAPERSLQIARRRGEIQAAFETHASRNREGRFELNQPMRADVLAVLA